MARQIKRDSVKRVYMARVTRTHSDGRSFTREFGPYLVRAAASSAVTRERRKMQYGWAPTDVVGEVLSAPVGEWTVES